MRLRTLLLAVLALAGAGPHASAHAAFDGGAPLGEGSLHVELVGGPLPTAGTPMELRARTDGAPRADRADPNAPLEARLILGDAAGEWFPLVDAGEGVRSAPVSFSEAGPWSVEVRRGAHEARFDLVVWPRADAFLEPVGDAAEGVYVAGEPARVALRWVDAQGEPRPPAPDVLVRIEGAEGTEDVRPEVTSDGLLVVERTWDVPGERRVSVLSASSGLVPGARPPVPILVIAPEDAQVYDAVGERGTPAFGAPAALAALALVAALAARRRR